MFFDHLLFDRLFSDRFPTSGVAQVVGGLTSETQCTAEGDGITAPPPPI